MLRAVNVLFLPDADTTYISHTSKDADIQIRETYQFVGACYEKTHLLYSVVNNYHHEICALLAYYAASNGNPLPTFWETVSVPSSRVKMSFKMGTIRCPETSVKDYYSTLRNIPEERKSNQYRDGSLKSLITITMYLSDCFSLTVLMDLLGSIFSITSNSLLAGARSC
jgi:hypothetical protein